MNVWYALNVLANIHGESLTVEKIMKTGTTTILTVVGCGAAAALVYALFSNRQLDGNRHVLAGKDIFPRKLKRKTGSSARCVHSSENSCQTCRRLKTFCLHLVGYGVANDTIPDSLPDHEVESDITAIDTNNANIRSHVARMSGNNNATSVNTTDTNDGPNTFKDAENDTGSKTDTGSKHFNVVFDTPEAMIYRVEDTILPKEENGFHYDGVIPREEVRKRFSRIMKETALSIYSTYNNIVPPLRSDKGRVIRKTKKVKSVR